MVAVRFVERVSVSRWLGVSLPCSGPGARPPTHPGTLVVSRCSAPPHAHPARSVEAAADAWGGWTGPGADSENRRGPRPQMADPGVRISAQRQMLFKGYE